MREGLTIKKGGIVERVRWNSKLETPAYVTTDVTDRAHRFLFEDTKLDEDVTLRDVFLILQRNLDFYDDLLGNWCKEIVNEAFASEASKTECIQGGMQYLEVYWMLTEINAEGDQKALSGHHFPSFHGWGKWDDTTEGGFGVEMTPVHELMDYSLRLNQKMPIYDDIGRIPKPPRIYYESTYTLGHILYGIIWELSFFGSPAMRNVQREEILDTAKENKPKA